MSGYWVPAAGGPEFPGAVRDEHPDLPFVAFTGEGSEEVASEAFAGGESDA